MIFFVDIDGTIRDYAEGIIPSAVKALELAGKSGHRLILCTGRTTGMIPKDVPLELFDGVIAGGGCYIALSGRILENSHIPDRTVAKYRSYFDNNCVPYSLETVQGMFMNSPMSAIIRTLLLSGEDPETSDLKGLRSESIRCDRTLEEFDEMGLHASKLSFCLTREQYKSFSVPDEDALTLIHFTDSSDEYDHCELISRGCDKGDALTHMTRALGAKKSDTVMFGDSMNDASAFAAAGTAVCMGNAPDDVKALADMVTDHVTNDGFYKAILTLLEKGQ
ncbi:MAG: HAD hydrolase family protein [Oscillospiraceae bacterium]|nr:HAD hydrolase family protein [Oscillospiraceae bacterium]